MSKLAELIRQEKHPAIQIVLRALAHIRDKIDNGADVDVIYGNDYVIVMTKTGRLIIKKVEDQGVDRIRVVYVRINKHYCEGTKVTLKQYVIDYNKELLESLIYRVDTVIETAVIDGTNIDESIDDIVNIVKALAR
jgi:hypothetical protein